MCGGPGSDGSARGRLESVKSAPPPLWSLCSPAWAMENGAVYRPTTEEDPGPARGARSGLAACCNLGRLRLPRRVLKGLQLVSPGRGGRAGRGGARPRALGLWAGEARPPLILVVREAAVSTPRFLRPPPPFLPPLGGPWSRGGPPTAMQGR